jgi:hypothetical protein
MLNEYSNLLLGLFFSFLISLVLMGLSIFFVYQKPEREKLSAYDVVLRLLEMLVINLKLNII